MVASHSPHENLIPCPPLIAFELNENRLLPHSGQTTVIKSSFSIRNFSIPSQNVHKTASPFLEDNNSIKHFSRKFKFFNFFAAYLLLRPPFQGAPFGLGAAFSSVVCFAPFHGGLCFFFITEIFLAFILVAREYNRELLLKFSVKKKSIS